jgi:pimeloyl-ACP methyl ester carboxylesterase
VTRLRAVQEGDEPATSGRTIKLRDGRSLGFAEYGNREGQPIFHFHGWPSSRLDAQVFAGVAAKFGVRLIGVDRPGMGLSDFQPGRRIQDWPDDVVELADALGIERFGVQGMSGGGPYASVCAHKIPERLAACGIIAGMGPIVLGTKGMMPTNRLTFFLARWFPRLLRPALWTSLGRFNRDAEKMEAALGKVMQAISESDKELMRDPQIKRPLVAACYEAFRRGSRGPAHDGKLNGHPWGFPLKEIALDKVHLWHGEHDVNVPVAMGRGVAKAIPHCQARFYPHDGHFLLTKHHLDEIMTAMIS